MVVFQEMGKNIVTVQEVVDEITSKRQLRRLIVLPYELKIMNVFPENVSFSKPNFYNTVLIRISLKVLKYRLTNPFQKHS